MSQYCTLGFFNKKCLGHRTTIFANGRSSLKFCVAYITGTFVKIPSISSYSLGYSLSVVNNKKIVINVQVNTLELSFNILEH